MQIFRCINAKNFPEVLNHSAVLLPFSKLSHHDAIKDFRPAPLAPEAFHRQNCDMPDSDPSSTSSARSSRDLPAEEGGDYCRRRDDVRLASAISGLRQRQPLSRSLRMMERRQAMRICIASLRMPRRVAWWMRHY